MFFSISKKADHLNSMPLLKLENHAKVKSNFFSKALNYLSNTQCLKLYIILTSYSKLHVAAAAKSLQLCLTVQPHRRQPTRLPHPWDSPGKNTGVGCHFLLQCMKVKRESEVTQSCQTLSDPMDCSLSGSSVHGICQARVLECVAIAFSRFFFFF